MADRTPPQDIEAEVAVLGSMLLDPEAAGRVVSLLKPSDFYRGPHAEVYAVLVELYDANRAIDIVLLREELQRRGVLEKVGGTDFLSRVLASVPTAANAEHYARIVKDAGTRRQVIQAANAIEREAYEGAREVGELVDFAESQFFELDRKSDGEAVAIRDVLQETFQKIDAMQGQQGRLTGVPSGFYDLDDMTSGLQKGELIVVAGRPSMGKTTFCLNLCEHAATDEQFAVAIFSLEMSKQSLVQNMLCSRARVDSHKLRRGFLADEDWGRISQALGKLSEARIFIDDTPGLSPLLLRAKARRLKTQHDIGLIVIDYLQLMEVPHLGRGDPSRQAEISYISRSLKGLARELEVPIIALSQLNRGVDSREDHRPRMSDLRECVTGDTLVCLTDGRRVPIRDLVGMEPDVWSLGEGAKLVAARSDRVWKVGTRPVLRVRLASGRSVRVTAKHRLLGFDGWRRAGELAVGDRVAIARRLPAPSSPERWNDDRVALLGQLVGDGSYLVHQPLRYTTSSEDNAETVRSAAAGQFGATVRRYRGRRSWFQLLLSGNGDRWHPRGVGAWLRELGVFGQRSHEKRIPERAFRMGDDQVALLLRHLWATDGTVWTRTHGRGAHRVYYATNSRALADDVAALLLRLGIVARTYVARQGRHRPNFHVTVSGAEAQRAFLDAVGAHGPRVAQADRLRAALKGTVASTNVDTVPRECFARVKATMRRRGVSHRAMAAMRGTVYGGDAHFGFAPSRPVLAEYADLLDDDVLRRQATSDVFWDEVVAVDPAGEEEVFDLTVPGPSNWLADGIVSHNSGAIEQDADVVMFLYRPEYYEMDPDRKAELAGQAECIVGKQRNGPTGTVNLTFLAQYMRFENAARERF